MSDKGVTPPKSALITKTKGVCGGVACIANTRIPVWLLALCRSRNVTVSNTLLMYCGLGLDHVRAALAYADANPEEIAADIAANDEA